MLSHDNDEVAGPKTRVIAPMENISGQSIFGPDLLLPSASLGELGGKP